MKGFYIEGYYYGYVPSVGKYWQFKSETTYCEFLRERGEI